MINYKQYHYSECGDYALPQMRQCALKKINKKTQMLWNVMLKKSERAIQRNRGMEKYEVPDYELKHGHEQKS